MSYNSTYRLRYWNNISDEHILSYIAKLQQYLPFTVLKLCKDEFYIWSEQF